MRKVIFLLTLLTSIFANAQAMLTSWTMNAGQYASYWQNSNGSPTSPSFVFHTSTTLADVKQVCYNDTYVWVKSDGMTDNMGQFLNPGAPSAQNYTYRFPRNPTVPNTIITSPLGGSIGLLTDGVFVLDATLGAHPQQQGAYHSHAKPYRLYSTTATTEHSPIVGYAFDGNPVYGPYGYSNPTDATSTVTRMKSGYSLRNTTTRTTLPYGVALTAADYGPAVNSTYPLGTYVEDYEWLVANGGDLDKYNGRFCVTPEYPSGTYAYFVTINAAGTPQFPYYIGTQYYGTPETDDITMGATITIPSTGTACFTSQLGTNEFIKPQNVATYPNPSYGIFNLILPDLSGNALVEIYTITGQMVFSNTTAANTTQIDLSNKAKPGIFILKVTNAGKEYTTKIMLN